MNTTSYLEKQLENLNALLHGIAGDISEEEWLARPLPGQNRIGFNTWHIPRTQDNIVQLWIRGGTELFHRPAWEPWRALRPLGIGVGISLDQADAVATQINLTETLAYADAVHEEILNWLRQISDDELDIVPDCAAHLATYPEYQTEGYRAELASLVGQPTWSLLMRPCIGHIHRHLGELELAKAMLRAG